MTFLLCDVVFAGCKHVSGPREYDGILFYKLYLFVVCIENIVLQLCKTRYDGESSGHAQKRDVTALTLCILYFVFYI